MIDDALGSAQCHGDVAEVAAKHEPGRELGAVHRDASVELHRELARRGVLRAADREQDRDEDRRDLEWKVVHEDAAQVEAARQPARRAGAHR